MPPMPEAIRARLIRSLVRSYVAAVVIQALVFLIVLSALGALLHIVLVPVLHATQGSGRITVAAAAVVSQLVLAAFFAIAVGFFGARTLLRAQRRLIPPHLAVPTRPVPLSALSVGLIVAVIDLFGFERLPAATQSFAVSWLPFAIMQLIFIAGIWFGAVRCLNSRAVRALLPPAGPVQSSGAAYLQTRAE